MDIYVSLAYREEIVSEEMERGGGVEKSPPEMDVPTPSLILQNFPRNGENITFTDFPHFPKRGGGVFRSYIIGGVEMSE